MDEFYDASRKVEVPHRRRRKKNDGREPGGGPLPMRSNSGDIFRWRVKVNRGVHYKITVVETDEESLLKTEIGLGSSKRRNSGTGEL